MLILRLLSLSVLWFYSAAQANIYPAYYGEEFYEMITRDSDSDEIKTTLRKILSYAHVVQEGEFDRIMPSCPSSREGRCYQHGAIGYSAARVFLMGTFYILKTGNSFAVKDVYCERYRESSEFLSDPPRPGKVPNSKVVNIEHTWPQSQFSKRFDNETQKSDMHHLFPTDSALNSVRSSHIFGEVDKDLARFDCPARFGLGSAGTDEVFEPPQSHKGNVARALFYFSIRYDKAIDKDEEKILRKWHLEDPVDEEEALRNEEIFKLQKNRNPFIDFPELVELVSNF